MDHDIVRIINHFKTQVPDPVAEFHIPVGQKPGVQRAGFFDDIFPDKQAGRGHGAGQVAAVLAAPFLTEVIHLSMFSINRFSEKSEARLSQAGFICSAFSGERDSTALMISA